MKPDLERIADALEGILAEMQRKEEISCAKGVGIEDFIVASNAVSDAYEKSMKPQKLERCEELNGRVE